MIIAIYAAIFLCAVGAAVVVTGVGMASAVRLPSPMILARPRVAYWNLLAVLGRLMSRLSRHTEDVRGRLIYTGSRVTVEEFGGMKVVTALVGGMVGLSLVQELRFPTAAGALLGGLIGMVAPDVWLRVRVAKRQKAIVRLMPEVIDLLSLCIGAGLDFLVSLNKVVALPNFKREPLIEELVVALQEIKLGKRRAEALRALSKRLNIPELASFLRTVVQADRMGTPIAEALARHSEDLRSQRFMRAERAALQAPIKILGPLIFCIMPCVAIIGGAPIFLQFMRQSPFGQ